MCGWKSVALLVYTPGLEERFERRVVLGVRHEWKRIAGQKLGCKEHEAANVLQERFVRLPQADGPLHSNAVHPC